VLDTSVGGVEEREMCEVDALDESETLAAGLVGSPVYTPINGWFSGNRRVERRTAGPVVAVNTKFSDR
jgi:hypothetical protein